MATYTRDTEYGTAINPIQKPHGVSKMKDKKKSDEEWGRYMRGREEYQARHKARPMVLVEQGENRPGDSVELAPPKIRARQRELNKVEKW